MTNLDYANSLIPTMRSWSETVFRIALDGRDADEAAQIIDRFYTAYRDAVAADPTGHPEHGNGKCSQASAAHEIIVGMFLLNLGIDAERQHHQKISANNDVERFFAMAYMILGQVGLTYAIGLLGSIIDSLGNQSIILQEKIHTCQNIAF